MRNVHAILCEMFAGFRNFDQHVNGVRINGVIAGSGAPLLLLHGYPQTHAIWHKIAPQLAQKFTVVATDLRGYGDSGKPSSDEHHAPYSKRELARDQLLCMRALGFETFHVAGHDRGGRVAHRLALDSPEAVRKLAILDIVPTYDVFANTNKAMATAYFHWFFLIQPFDMPERMIGANPALWIERQLLRLARTPGAITPEAYAEYLRCFSDPACIHATCEDYRAAASIDLEHDAGDRDKHIACPTLILWGQDGFVGRNYDVMALWRERALRVAGSALPGGHYVPEEAPGETLDALLAHFSGA